MSTPGSDVFDRARSAAEQAIRGVGYRRRLTPHEVDEFRSFVWWKLIESDYARLRKFEGSGSLRAYLNVVVRRLYLDYQISKWGKWHPSREAHRRGDVSVMLERLIYRDGLPIGDAVELVWTLGCDDHSREELSLLACELPARHRPRFVSEEHLFEARISPAVDPIEGREHQGAARRLQDELVGAMEALRADERRILQLRYGQDRSVPEIASMLGLQAKPLYARIRRLLGRLRDHLARRGIGCDDTAALVAATAPLIDLDAVFPTAAA